jgi:DNA mismatch endonuclease, patch repair protein
VCAPDESFRCDEVSYSVAAVPTIPKPAASSYNAFRTMQANQPGSRVEQALRHRLWRAGLRYRVHSSLPGRPDAVFARARVALFVHGCFWHGCDRCALPRPSANREFWAAKLAATQRRDAAAAGDLGRLGWTVVVVWECEIRTDLSGAAERVAEVVTEASATRAEPRPQRAPVLVW